MTHLIVAAGGHQDAVPDVSEWPECRFPSLVARVGGAVIAEALLNDVHVPACCSQPQSWLRYAETWAPSKGRPSHEQCGGHHLRQERGSGTLNHGFQVVGSVSGFK